jgi:hypothetical protein
MHTPGGLLLIMLLVSACESECEQAADLLDSCRDEIRAESQASRGTHPSYFLFPITHVDPNDCSGDNLCLAECLNEADCAAIAHAAVHGNGDPSNPPPPGAIELTTCANECFAR